MSQTEPSTSRRSRRDADRAPTAEQTTALHQVQVQAARLRLVTDRKLGKTSPPWVRQLAAEDGDAAVRDV